MTDDKATPADELAEAIERVGEQTQPNIWRNGVAAIRDTDGRLLLTALAAERDRADRAEAALGRLSDAHDVHVEMDKTFEYECPQCRHEATA